MNPFAWLLRSAVVTEQLVELLLRSPTFHRGVRRIHRTVEELRHGRDPAAPMRQGEATADPREASRGGTGGFFKLFAEEIRNQAKGSPTSCTTSTPTTTRSSSNTTRTKR
ncbi:hypothetical protein BX600DRAFT_510996 [Xylariales sp. PMI_506]|nr:hypothetical protein BX600DRAFT_510996 [Xylariales sp. PMI_506]